MKKLCKFTITSVLVLFFAFFINNQTNSIYGMDSINEKFNVLVINSYHQGDYWEKYIIEGLEKTIKNEKHENNINLHIEYLNIDESNSKEYLNSVKKMLEVKYPKGTIDAIYAIDDIAYEVFLKEIVNKKSVFYHKPLVFSSVNKKLNISSEQEKYTVGMYSIDHSLGLFSFIRNLTPEVKNINVILDESSYCDTVKYEMDKLLRVYLESYININYIRSNYIEDIVTNIDNMKEKKDTVNIIMGKFKNSDFNKYLKPKETVDIIKNHTKNPIYTNTQIYLNAGVLGGYVEIGQEFGKIAAKTLIQLEDGKSIVNMESGVQEKSTEVVDYKSIYEYKINPFNVGNNVEVINKKPYQILIPTWMKGAYLLILFLVIIILSQYINICMKSKKKEEEKKFSKEREKLMTEFIINLSHELRTPINVILNTSKIMELNINKNNINKEDMVDKLQNINQNSYRLLKIANNIIDLTKIKDGMLELNIENCNIVSIVEEIFISSIHVGKKKKIKMIFDTDVEEIITAIDIFQIQRVVLNLLSNAIKFTNEGGLVLLSIKKEEKENVVIEVSDTGIGIPKEKLNCIFDSFYQVDNSLTRKNEGSGIGLCISKDIIEVHNGRIEVKSEENRGSIFRVYIPIKTIEENWELDKLKIIKTGKIVDLEMSDI
ncbi:ATP-binding protein [Romboutsia sp.]|uniref:sensor histidine kinase n=1 Tax=Romboutsia sp. TaxID=1965302 RepID=UPI003F372CF8